MKNFFKIMLPFFTLLMAISLNLYSQSAESVIELEQETNKLFVVIGVILIIFIGIIIYLFSLDRKIKKIKRDIESNQ